MLLFWKLITRNYKIILDLIRLISNKLKYIIKNLI